MTRLRSLLFAPATRPEMVAKLPRSGPDGVVIDLEDAVPPAAKVEARALARHSASELVAQPSAPKVFVRVNAVPTDWFADDVATAVPGEVAGIVVPKVDQPGHVEAIATALRTNGLDHLEVIAGIETARGVWEVSNVLGAPITATYFGAEDYTADLGGERRDDNHEVLFARSRVGLAARLAGIPVLDQVVTDFSDDARFLREAELGKALGYGGKLCIHPQQVPLANNAFVPSDAEVDRCRRLLAAYEAAGEAGVAAIEFEGQMVDEPLARRARSVLASAELSQ